MINKVKIKSVVIKGLFHFTKNSEYGFAGPFRKGLRPIIWHAQVKGEATTCTLISDIEINEGESKEALLFILNEFQLGLPMQKGVMLRIGSIVHSKVIEFGQFDVYEHLGEWQGGKIS